MLTDDWKADGYRWYQNGRKVLPTTDPVVVKTYYLLLVEGPNAPVKSKEFKKVTYHLCGDLKGTQGTLIQYLGNAVTNNCRVYAACHTFRMHTYTIM